MRRLIILIYGLLLLSPWLTAAAQQASEPDGTSTDGTEVEAGDDAADDDEAIDDFDDSDLDLQTYEEDDDDFVPTEEIPADEAIPFPSDI